MKQIAILAILVMAFTVEALSQCANWNSLPNKTEIEEAHVLYRDFFKAKNYKEALGYWKKAYEAAPAADGKRDWHFSNGIDMHLELYKVETDEAKKEAYKQTILKLYDEWVKCIEAGSIEITGSTNKEYAGYIRGREAFNMYYFLNMPYDDDIKMIDECLEKAGNKAEYIVFDPYARIVVFEFTNKQMDKATARKIHKKLNDVADYNIANNKELGSYYATAKEAMNAVFAQIEDDIFDCDYFMEKLVPEYKAAPNDGELVKRVYVTLLQKGCNAEEPIMVEMNKRYVAYADSVNAVLQADFYAKNPGAHARDLYKDEKYDEAIKKWEEAISQSESEDKVAEYNYWIGYTKFHKKQETSSALTNARRGLNSPDYRGKALMLIGDAYARLSRGCGDASWEQRLAIIAVIDKYQAAKAADPSIADEANRKIGIYSSSLPERQAGFMRKVGEGETVNLSCLGESVRVRYID